MLTLTRKVNEVVTIGDNIRVMVTRIGWGKVQLGIEAPRDVPIRREDRSEHDKDQPPRTA
jgi:carbon storage regulator